MSAERFIKTPHLPEGRVRLAAIGGRYLDKLAAPLENRGVRVLRLPDNPDVDISIAGHADVSLLHMGGRRFVAAKGVPELVNLLTNSGAEVISSVSEQSAVYPGDIGLNGCFAGKFFIHDLRWTDRAVLEAMPDGAELISVNQGYAKCSVCVVDIGSVITSDAGIAKAAAVHGIETLLIKDGFIGLPGFETGFIGGCAFRLSGSELAFTGSLDGHPDKDAILSFITRRGIKPVFLTPEPIFDIGSAVPLLESV